MDLMFALIPAFSPQEKVNRFPSRFPFTVSSVRATSIQIFKNHSQQCPLLGERKQVRANEENIFRQGEGFMNFIRFSG